jgi:hypothetical protein
MTLLKCETCQHWDPALIRLRGKPESLCRCQDSAEYRHYVNAYHKCHWHQELAHSVSEIGEYYEH